jgi:hypothetical protein
MSDEITRPQADKRKISSKNEFELCYIRHQYFRRSTYNPSEEEMAPYVFIVKKQARNTYFTYKTLFNMVGFESEDVTNIGLIHLVSFLGLFSMEMLPEKYCEFVEKFTKKHVIMPDEEDVLAKNRANFTIFLKQRMEEVVRVCRQKARNIRGVPTEEFQPFYGPKKPPQILKFVLDDHEKYGFRKMDISVFKSVRRRAGAYGQNVFRHDGVWYLCVPLEHRNLGLTDFAGAGMDPHDNIHNMNPEQILFRAEDTQFWERKKRKFKYKSKEERAQILMEFIDKNEENEMFAEEVKIAKRTLRRMGLWNQNTRLTK